MRRFSLKKEKDISTILKIAEDQLASAEIKHGPLQLVLCNLNF